MGKDEPNVFCFIDVTHKHTKCLLDKIISKQEKEAKKKITNILIWSRMNFYLYVNTHTANKINQHQHTTANNNKKKNL